MSAFGKTGARERLLTSIDEAKDDNAPILFSRGSYDNEQLQAFSEETGLAPALIVLVRSLSHGKPDFSRALIAAVPEGADTSTVADAWLNTVWQGIAAKFSDPALDKAAGQSHDLRARALAGEELAPRVWREARAAFRLVEDKNAAAAAAILASATWDPRTTPGAMHDVILAWVNFIQVQKTAELGWTEEHDRMQKDYYEAMFKQAEEKAGERANTRREWMDTDEGKVWRERFDAALKQYRDTVTLNVPNIGESITHALNEIYSQGQQILLSVVTAQKVAA